MLRVVVIILVFVSAIFVFSAQQPEQIFARSDDGVVTLEGVSRVVRSVTIEPTPLPPGLSARRAGGSSPLGRGEDRVSLPYKIVPDVTDNLFSASLTVQILEQWKQEVDDPSELKIFIYRKKSDEWESLPTDVDLSRGTLNAQINLSEPVWLAVDDLL